VYCVRSFRNTRDLVAGDETRRAEVQQDRACRVEARGCAEVRSTGRWLHRKEVIETRGAGDDNAILGNVVIADRFAFLMFVPHQHAIGSEPHETAIRQVVPAERKKRDGYAEPVCALYI